MKRLTNLLVVGGTGRNIGKTTFVEMLVARFHKETTGLVALKTSMLLPGEEYLHGDHKLIKPDEFELFEENDPKGIKDSQRYLKAGAAKSYFLSTGDQAANRAMDYFWKTVGSTTPVIAESNVLTNHIIPGLFIMVKGQQPAKPEAAMLLKKADFIVAEMDMGSFKRVVDGLYFENGTWFFKDAVI